MDENPSVDETIIPSDEPVEEEVIVEETIEAPSSEERTYTQAEWTALHGRTKKAEAELKTLKGQPAKAPASPSNVEETVLLATGFNEDLLPELKAVAQVRKVSLIKAQNDPIFIAVKEKFEKDKKSADASLPASRGSSAVKVKKTLNTPGLTREEHRALVQSI